MALYSRDTKVEALKRAPLFEGLSRKELTALAQITEDVDVKVGKVLCREGASGGEPFRSPPDRPTPSAPPSCLSRADYSMRGALAADPDQQDDVVGFHARGVVEKAMKAVLAVRGLEIPRTHDLASRKPGNRPAG